MNRIDTKIPRGLAIVAICAFIWGLGEGLFIFFLPLALQRWNTDAVQIGAVPSMIGDRPETVYIASLGALALTVGLNMLLFHEKRKEILPTQT